MPTNTLGDPIVQRLTAPGQMLEMEEIDVGGVTLRAWKNAPRSLRAVLDLSALHGERDFIVYEDERWTFSQHYKAVAAVADWLANDAGVRKGDRVAISMRNFPEWSIAFWAAAVCGAIVVPLNSWWTGDELRYGLDDSGTKILFCDIERYQRIEPHLPALGVEHVVVAKSQAPPDTTDFDSLLAREVDAPPDVEIAPDDEATIFYTSGTTGNPKGALGTHRNICQNLFNLVWSAQSRAAQAAAADPDKPAAAPPAQPTQLLSVPFFHVTGCHSTLVPTLAAGTKLVLMYRWNPERALELIERERITSFGGVPTMVWQVLESPDFATRDTSSVVGIGYGGAPAPPELVRRIKEHFPAASPGNGYGLTEISSLAVGIGGQDYFRKPDSVGRPMPIVDVKVVREDGDEDGEEVGPNTLGELWMRGPNVVKGYWNKPEPTAETFRDGWLVTGDVAEIDDDGFIFIRDRAKDMVIRGGENVYCVEIETVLYEHPAVSEAAVIGLPHLVLGEEVAAVVKRVPGAEISEEELKDHVAQRLAAFKVPVRIAITDEPLPRNAAGKVLKRELRDALTAAAL